MADQSYTFEFQTIGDVTKAEQVKRALDGVADAQKRLGVDASEVEANAKRVGDALETQAAKALKLDEALRKASDSARQSGVDSSSIDSARAANRANNGLPELGKLDAVRDKAKEIFDAYRSVGGGVEGMFNALMAGGGKLLLILAAVKTALTVITDAVREFAAEEKALASLTTAMEQAGSATAETRQKYIELASSMEAATAIAEGKWIEVLKQLTQFGSLPETIERDVQAVKNLTGITGNLESSTMLITRAMQGNFEMFRRYGIIVEDAGTQTEKLEKLFRQLAERGGGQLETQAETLTGQFDRLKNATSNLLETIGGMISSSRLLQITLNLISTSLEGINKILPDTSGHMTALNNRLAATAAAAMAAKDATASYVGSLKSQNEEVEKLVAHLREQLDLQSSILRLQDEQDNAQMALALARVDRQHAEGRLSSEDAAIARANIRDTYQNRSDDRRGAELQNRATSLEFQRDELEEGATRASQTYLGVRGQHEDREAMRARASERMNRLRRQIEETEANRPPWWSIGLMPGARGRDEAADAHIDTLNNRQSAINQALRNQPILPDLDTARGQANQQVSGLSEELRKLQTEIQKNTAELESFNRTRGIAAAARIIGEETEIGRTARAGSRADIAAQLESLNRRIESSITAGQNPVSLFEQRRQLERRDLDLQPELRPSERASERERIQQNFNRSVRENSIDPTTNRPRPRADANTYIQELEETIGTFNETMTRAVQLLTDSRTRIASIDNELRNSRNLEG